MTKILVVLLGLFVCFTVLEGFLFLGGLYYVHQTRKAVRLGIPRNAVRVLCIGDSMTYGVGAESNASYPAWLEKILSERLGRTVKTVNAGIISNNSTLVRKRLGRLIHDISPDVVVFLAGTANYWNYQGYCESDDSSVSMSRLRLLAGKSRVFNFVYLLLRGLRAGNVRRPFTDFFYGRRNDFSLIPVQSSGSSVLDSAIALRLAGDNDGAMAVLNDFIAGYDKADQILSLALLQAGQIYRFRGDFQHAGECFERAVNEVPYSEHGYYGMGLLCLDTDESSQALDWFIRAVSIRPDKPLAFPLLNEVLGRTEEFDRILAALKKLETEGVPGVKNLIEVISGRNSMFNLLDSWLVRDIKEIIRICRANGVKLVILSYPDDPGPSAILRRQAMESGIDFADIEKWFLSCSDRQKLFCPDNYHLNAAGYKGMAEVVADTIIAQGLLVRPERK